MAFTDAQRASIRLYLGWPARFFQENSALEQAMNNVEMQAAEAAQCVAIISLIADVDSRIVSAYTRLKALKVGPIGLSGGGELMALRSEGTRRVAQLASVLGINTWNDYFTSVPYDTGYEGGGGTGARDGDYGGAGSYGGGNAMKTG